MKRLLLLLHLSLLFLYGNNELEVKQFMVYKSTDKSITSQTISEKNASFVPLTSQEQLKDKSAIYWIKVQFSPMIKLGKYLVAYQEFDFSLSTFSPQQHFNRFISNKVAVFSFEYDPNRDSTTYYFKLINCYKHKTPTLSIIPYNKYYAEALLTPDSRGFFLLFGLIAGLIVMVVIYNLSIYAYTKEVSFLHYSLMELFMLWMLFYQVGILSLDIVHFNMASLLSGLFANLFMQSFLDTKKYLPKLHNALNFYIFLIFVDILHLNTMSYSLISNFALYSFFGPIYFIVGIWRYLQGFKPAKFFLIGWSMLVVSIFYTEHMGDIYGINPLLFGPPLEAVLLAMGLAFKLKLLLDEKREQQELLIHQSRLASMGEMIGNIAHQWKQPLTYLSYIFMNLRETSKRKIVDISYLNKKLDKAGLQLDFMSQTIDNFRDFYLPNKEKNLFSLKEASEETFEIIKPEFKEEYIRVVIDIKEEAMITSYKSEYKQVLLNILTNAKEAFQKNRIACPLITILFEKNSIIVSDNAGGIPKNILNRIYDPYFTTKKGNSGIGLYMSKMIVEKSMGGALEVENGEEGAVFKIKF